MERFSSSFLPTKIKIRKQLILATQVLPKHYATEESYIRRFIEDNDHSFCYDIFLCS